MRHITILAALLAAGALASPASAQSRVKIGTLDCSISGGVGMIIASQKAVSCRFSPSDRGRRREAYVGTITRVGVDLGVTSGARLVWAVYAPTSQPRWALAGSYGGAGAEATVGAGVGANALLGGSNRTVVLQPLSFQGQSGVNVAAGVAGLELHPAR
jgi:hypothetical protein